MSDLDDVLAAGLTEIVQSLNNLSEVIRREGRLNRAVALLNSGLNQKDVMKFLEDIR